MSENTLKTNGLIRYEDDQGHLLFCYNPTTNQIEIYGANRGGSRSTRRKKYGVDVDRDIRALRLRNVISDDPPVKVIQAELLEDYS